VINKILTNNLHENDKILYSEWVPAGRFVKIATTIVITLMFTLGAIFTMYLPINLAFVGLILGVIGVIIFLVYWNYRGLQINLTNRQLEVYYGKLNRKRIPLNQINRCDITKAHFRIYGGVGIRLGLDGSSAYNTDFGDAIKLTFHHGRPFLFSTRNPQKLCELIKAKSN
jgi:uncharacterized membrane protein YdbT with pleckstrin-like domain